MKKIFFISIVGLMFTLTACEDEFIESAEDRMAKELNAIDNSVEEDNSNVSARGDSINTNTDWDEEIKYPIGFGVTVKDYNEVDLDYNVEI